MDDEYTPLGKLIELVTRFRDKRDWKKFHNPKDLSSAIGIEASELSELFLWKNQEEIKDKLTQRKFREKVADEMADIQMYLLSLSDVTGINISQAVVEKMKKNAKKYPVDKCYGSAAKYNECKEGS